MAILFKLNESGKVTIYPYGITNGTHTQACSDESYANNLLLNSRYSDYAIINGDTPTEDLLGVLKGKRFDSVNDAESFINGGGYENSIEVRMNDIENIIADLIGGDE